MRLSIFTHKPMTAAAMDTNCSTFPSVISGMNRNFFGF